MIRKFNCNHYLKGRIQAQMGHFIESGAISFEKGTKRNVCIVIINENMILDKYELDYMYKTLIPVNREIK